MPRRKLGHLANLGDYAQPVTARTRKAREKKAREKENQACVPPKMPLKRVLGHAARFAVSPIARGPSEHTAPPDDALSAGAHGFDDSSTIDSAPGVERALVERMPVKNAAASPTSPVSVPAVAHWPMALPSNSLVHMDSGEQQALYLAADERSTAPTRPNEDASEGILLAKRNVVWHPPTVEEALAALQDLKDVVHPSGPRTKTAKRRSEGMIAFLTHYTDPRGPTYNRWIKSSVAASSGLGKGSYWQDALRKETRAYILARAPTLT